MSEDKRIYVVLPALVQVPAEFYVHNGATKPNLARKWRYVEQPAGRQVAQACHVVSKLRHNWNITFGGRVSAWFPITTIILQARDSAEMMHVYESLERCKGIYRPYTHLFSDLNVEAYGSSFQPITALATLANPKKVKGILGYLPLWGSQ